jgi:hypothetical protein
MGSVRGAPGAADPEPTWQTDPVIEKVTALIAKKDWPGAAGLMKDAVASAPQNAEYHNMYAYTVRKGPNPDMNVVFKHYTEALRLKPDYRGAHEYIGEAYLMVNNLPKAREHLSALDKLCFFPCSEHTDLKKAIAEFESKRAAR